MTNKEWLEKCKKYDEENVGKIELIQNPLYGEYRQAKALEIIAEELIKLNENMDRDYVLKRGTIDQDGYLVNEE